MKSKTVLITGSTSGIGWELARRFGAQGAHVILNGFPEDQPISALITQLEKYGAQADYYNADCARPDEIEAMIKTIQAQWGGIDILINNAGVQHVANIEEFPPQEWDRLLAINLSAAFHTTRLCVPMMRQAGWGRIINIASVHAKVASPYKSAYVAAKHGLLGLTKSVALELAAHQITCNAICPGYVRTALVDQQIPATAQQRGISEDDVINHVMLLKQATKKFVGREEVSALALHLCQDEARSITGACLDIDGGFTAS